MSDTVRLANLKLNERNPRRIKDPALDRLARSIERDPEFMRLRPIVVDDAGMVLGGNQRLKACRQLGMKEVPAAWVVKAADLTEEQRKRFILVDNAPEGMAGDWDLDLVQEDWTLPELEELGFDLTSPDEGPFYGESGNVAPSQGVWSKMCFPPAVWLKQRDEIIQRVETILHEYGGVSDWAS